MVALGRFIVLLLFLLSPSSLSSETVFKRSCLNHHRQSTYLSGGCVVLHEGNAKNRADANTQCNSDYTNGHLATIYSKAHIDRIALLLDLSMPVWCSLKRDENDTNFWLHTPSDTGPKPKANNPPWDPSIANNPTLIGDGVMVGENGMSNEDETQIHPYLCQYDEPISDPTEYNKHQDGYRASNDDVLNQWTVENIFVCAKNCDKILECKSFAFSAASRECHLYSIPSEALSLASDSDYELFDKIMKDTDCLSKNDCAKENTHFLLIGGAISNMEEIYPLNPSQSGIVATLTHNRQSAMAEWYDGKVLIIGGWDILSTLLFDPDTKVIIPVDDMPLPARYKAASTTLHGAAVVCGGFDNAGSENMVSCVKFQNYLWVSMPSLNVKRQNLRMGNLKNKIYAVGGWNNEEGASIAVEQRFDPSANTPSWTILNSLPVESFLAGLAVFRDTMFLCGGYGPSQPEVCYKYNEASDQWVSIGSMNIERLDCHLLEFNGNLFVVTGLDKDYNPVMSFEVYDHVTDAWNITGINKIEDRAEFSAVVV